MEPYFDYYQFQKDKIIKSIKTEIQFYQGETYGKAVSDYIYYLQNRIGTNKPENKKITDGKYELTKLDMNEYAKDLDIMVFKKPWNKLKEFHKIMKIKEFIKDLKGENHEEKLIRKLSNGLREKKFNKGKSVIEYDPEQMKILDISCVIYDKKKKRHTIDWDY